jgi:hypothetical protein
MTVRAPVLAIACSKVPLRMAGTKPGHDGYVTSAAKVHADHSSVIGEALAAECFDEALHQRGTLCRHCSTGGGAKTLGYRE